MSRDLGIQTTYKSKLICTSLILLNMKYEVVHTTKKSNIPPSLVLAVQVKPQLVSLQMQSSLQPSLGSIQIYEFHRKLFSLKEQTSTFGSQNNKFRELRLLEMVAIILLKCAPLFHQMLKYAPYM